MKVQCAGSESRERTFRAEHGTEKWTRLVLSFGREFWQGKLSTRRVHLRAPEKGGYA